MMEKIKKVIFTLLIFIACLTLIPFHKEVLAASESHNTVFIKKVSKDFTRKFCNAIGFGLSSDSALKFSVGENKKERSKKNKIIDLDTDYLSEQISTEIVENCGYNIGYEGFEGINKFKEYILKNKVIDSFK